MRVLKMCLVCLSVILNSIFPCYAQTVAVESKTYSVDDYRGLKLYAPASKIVNFWWTGNEYIWTDPINTTIYKVSADMDEWKTIDGTSGFEYLTKHSNSPYLIKKWGDKYIVFYREYESQANQLSNAKRGEDTYAYPLIVLDSSFNLIKSVELDEPITGVSYADGKYYAQTQVYDKKNIFADPQNTIYVSDDALTWEKDESLMEVPLSNGGKFNLIFDGTRQNSENYYMRSLSEVSTNGDERTKILFENKLYYWFKSYDGLYISYATYDKSETFKISCDGVYWLDIEYPESEEISSGSQETVIDYIETKDKILFKTNAKKLYEYDKLFLTNAWKEAFGDDNVYIKAENSFLGFDTAPVIQDERTLIPIRFLFEQMGAEVTWNQDEQKATITQNDTAVTVGINDTEAEVNGQTVSMDVPAQLINDKTMVPVRFLSEELGYDVEWDSDNRIIAIE